ncbi:primosomal protein N', partial [bacterium]|nr:primosomal protein N' [bacterium]
LFGYPPFCKLIFIYVKHREDSTADMLSGQMARSLRMIFGDRILGPDSPPISRVQGMYIRKIILKIETGASLAEIRHRLREARNYFLSDARYKSAIIYYDVD